jgi:dTDP-glucose 4,6-dehydratase/GDP-L-fucose synthase
MTGAFWDDRTVMVTGGSGFLGGHLVEQLRERSSDVEVFVPRSESYDLRRRAAVRRAFEDSGADVLVHLAATVEGVGGLEARPGETFYDNATMGIQLLEEARRADIETATLVGTALSYPAEATVPYHESELFDGYPDETGAPYGIAKRALVAQARAYRRQWGFESDHVVLTNLYGPRDEFDPETAGVIPANVRRCIRARERGASSITAWGSGEPTRDFLYVRDAARGILDVTAADEAGLPVNLGSGTEISIRDLLERIAAETGFDGDIEWDTAKSDGQDRQRVDISRARERFGWRPATDLAAGLRATVAWYERHRRR